MAKESRYRRWQITRLRLAALSDYKQAQTHYRRGHQKLGDVFHKSGDSCSAKADELERKMK